MALVRIFGFPSIAHHQRWRASPEHAKVMDEMASLRKWSLEPAIVPGRGLFSEGEYGTFHVSFLQGRGPE